MSAQIIQFGARQATFVKPKPALRRRQRPERTSTHFAFGGQPYEALYEGDDLRCIYQIQFRITASGPQMVKRWNWSDYSYGLDPVIVKAAKLARIHGCADFDATYRQAALDALRQRQAKVARDLKSVEATIVVLEGALG
jgi:hypothetical protein